MDMRDLIDSTRLSFVSDSTIAPTRSVTYKRVAGGADLVLNAFVGGGLFNKEERDTIGKFCAFSGLSLPTNPAVMDAVTYEGIDWRVTRFTKMGGLFTVICENKRHAGRPSV